MESKPCDMDCFNCQHADCINDDFSMFHHSETVIMRQKRYKDAGLCALCGKKPLYTAWNCKECSDKIRARQNKLYADRNADGACPRCGGPREDPRYKNCRSCRKKATERQRRSYWRKKWGEMKSEQEGRQALG